MLGNAHCGGVGGLGAGNTQCRGLLVDLDLLVLVEEGHWQEVDLELDRAAEVLQNTVDQALRLTLEPEHDLLVRADGELQRACGVAGGGPVEQGAGTGVEPILLLRPADGVHVVGPVALLELEGGDLHGSQGGAHEGRQGGAQLFIVFFRHGPVDLRRTVLVYLYLHSEELVVGDLRGGLLQGLVGLDVVEQGKGGGPGR